MATQWRQRSSNIDIEWDDDLSELPDSDVWLFGRENRFSSDINTSLADRNIHLSKSDINWAGQSYSLDEYSLAVSINNGRNPTKQTIGQISSQTPETLKILARKLPHYGRYSYTLFQGDDVVNIAKEQWFADITPLVIKLVEGDIPAFETPRLAPLTDIQ